MPNNTRAIAIIPARYASSRFPGKPLANKTDRPLIQHVIDRVEQARLIDRVIVATDDQRIADAVGPKAVMTGDHPNGTSRIAEVVSGIGYGASGMGNSIPDIIINVQGDEPEIEPQVIDQLIEGLASDPDAKMATLASDFADDEDPADPNIVKVIVNQKGHAIYFSRSLIPYDRDKQNITPLKHPGLYAYRPAFLLEYANLPATPLEQIEQLEQLRAIEHGYKIAVVKTTVRHHGIDTPEQYEQFVARWKKAQG